MKRFLICMGLVAAATTMFAQGNQASPSETATGSIGGKKITISYSSPRVKGREGHIFTKDGLISQNPGYPVWRAGANGATTLETDGDLQIGNLSVPKGKYSLFVDISDPDQWVLIVSKKAGGSGLAYDASQDLGKVKMKMSKPPSLVENLKYTIEDNGGKGAITLSWENHTASVPVSAK